MRVIFLLIFTMIVLISCDTDKSRCLKSTGEVKTEKIDLESFNNVVVRSDFEIYFENSSDYSITIVCGKNLIPYISHEIINKELILEDNNGCKWLRDRVKPKLIISCPSLKEISVYETCDLKCIDTIYFDNLSIQNWAGIFTTNLLLEGDSLFFRCHASTGDYAMEGHCNYAYMYNVGSGYLKASKLFCNTIYAVHSSIGNSEVNASQLLMIENIQYGKLYSFSEHCPAINDNDTDWGNSFVNIGCP
jgi:hypothetical protein